jgi:uncharacterized protein (TIGR03503 family)
MRKSSSMRKWVSTTCLVIALLAPTIAAAAVDPAPAAPVTDIRILIDISGSMKRNDPHNLRAPALRLIVGLLPPGAKAGVWTFGQYVNMLVPLNTVDEAWKSAARSASDQINSNGLYTNIEAALKRATWDWNAPDDRARRSIIMLTDGIVDVTKDKSGNAASRRRILDDILPRLQNAGVTVHTIALSHDADADLLKQLAAATKGWHEEVDNADALEKTFLHMFEKSAHRDTLPLVNNEVQVDKTIRELTLLVFRREDAKPSQLIDPLGNTIGQTSTPSNVHWHHETRYDLITIGKPAPGKWKVVADTDPDNRVMVVTDLKLQTATLPNHVLAEQPIPFTMSLTQDGAIITKPAFLKFIDAKVTQNDVDGKRWEWPLKDDGHDPDKTANDGIYTLQLGDSLTPGQHEIRVLVDGITFQRESRQLIDVVAEPVMASVTPVGADRPNEYTLSVIPRAGLIDPDTMKVHATISDSRGGSKEIDVPKSHHDEWSYTLTTGDIPGVYTVALNIEGRAGDGAVTTFKVGPLSYGEAPPGEPETATPAQTKDVKKAAETPAEPAPPTAVETAPAAPAPAPSHWMLISIVTGLTVVILAVGFVIYRRTHKKADQAVTHLEEELQPEQAAAASESEAVTEAQVEEEEAEVAQ